MDEDKDTRYYLDIDLATKTIIEWSFGPKDKLAVNLAGKSMHRIFLTKGQYQKITSKID